jgi:hypothetical protein
MSKILRVLLCAVLLYIAMSWFVRERRHETAQQETRANGASEFAANAVLEAPPADSHVARLNSPAADARTQALPQDTANDSAQLAFQLVDTHTAESVPWYTVKLRKSDGSKTEFETDSQGRFAPSADLEDGPLLLELVDTQSQPSTRNSTDTYLRFDHVVADKPLEIRALVGPTYFLKLDLPPGLTHEDLRATLFLDPPGFGDNQNGRRYAESLVRRGRANPAELWLRFRELLNEGDPLWLALQSRDGAWSGAARVPGGYGVHAEPVSIELSQRCRVRGTFASREVDQERRGASLALFRTQPLAADPLWSYAKGDGEFRIDDLDPGEYRLEVRDEAFRADAVSFVLHSGELDLGNLPWESIPMVGSVRLRVHSAVEVPIDVELIRRLDPPRNVLWHSDDWEEQPDGTFVSLFEWDEVYAGEYAIELHSHDTVNWHIELGTLTPPVEELVLHLPTPAPGLRFEVLDAQTGAAIAEWSLLVRQEHGWEQIDDSPTELKSMAWDPHTVVVVFSPGYQAWVVHPAELVAVPQGDQRLTVRLVPGWSRLFIARTRARSRPLAGTEIWLDDVRAGVTDSMGELWVHRALAPSALDVRHPSLVWSKPARDYEIVITWLSLRP